MGGTKVVRLHPGRSAPLDISERKSNVGTTEFLLGLGEAMLETFNWPHGHPNLSKASHRLMSSTRETMSVAYYIPGFRCLSVHCRIYQPHVLERRWKTLAYSGAGLKCWQRSVSEARWHATSGWCSRQSTPRAGGSGGCRPGRRCRNQSGCG